MMLAAEWGGVILAWRWRVGRVSGRVSNLFFTPLCPAVIASMSELSTTSGLPLRLTHLLYQAVTFQASLAKWHITNKRASLVFSFFPLPFMLSKHFSFSRCVPFTPHKPGSLVNVKVGKTAFQSVWGVKWHEKAVERDQKTSTNIISQITNHLGIKGNRIFIITWQILSQNYILSTR